MIVFLFRVLILVALAFLVYTIIQYIKSPRRKLQAAKRKKAFFLLDEEQNSKKNLQFVYKGCLFEGEKYVGITEHAFEVITILVTAPEPLDLRGFTRDDLYFLEEKLISHYPYAHMEWKHPINRLLITPVE
ncbi:sigma-w pathway protein ysdB [Lentibacillus sp. N15]|uniref:sigma-w pathway protein ysdB n=1 Tax=Lentibacillus songyuanensis TaxID=3136161 RepID=UPI0031BB28D3